NDIPGTLLPQIFVHASLDDAEQSLVVFPTMCLETTLRPAGRPLGRSLDIFTLSGIRGTLIKSHDDVRAQGVLNLNRPPRTHKQFLSTVMIPKVDTCLLKLAQFPQAEHLEPAALR